MKPVRDWRETEPPAQASGGFRWHQPMPGTGPGPARCLHSHSHDNGFFLLRRTSGEPVSPRNFYKLRLAFAASADSLFVLVNLVKNPAVSEVDPLRPLPAAGHFIHREQTKRWETTGGFRPDRRVLRTKTMLRRQFLSDVTVEIFEIGAGERSGAVFLHHLVHPNHGIFRQNADGWNHDLKLTAGKLLLNQRHLVFKR